MITYACVNGISYIAVPDDPDLFTVLYRAFPDDNHCPLCGRPKSEHNHPDDCRVAHVTRAYVENLINQADIIVTKSDWDRRTTLPAPHAH